MPVSAGTPAATRSASTPAGIVSGAFGRKCACTECQARSAQLIEQAIHCSDDQLGTRTLGRTFECAVQQRLGRQPFRARVDENRVDLRACVIGYGCVVLLRVYRDADRTSLAYDMARDFGCTQALVPVTIRPGETKEFSTPSISAAKILGDSLPNGRYYFTALIRPEGRRAELRAGSAELPVNTVGSSAEIRTSYLCLSLEDRSRWGGS